ncbi:MAG: nitroreductase family protein [Nitrospirae bacterium]|nr:MAG: nitroreductase family protein [Nitrospirota bacterium]
MDVFEAIETRRSVKRFDPDHRMTPEEEARLMRAALLAPTAFNIQHWRFVIVRDPELRARLREASWGQAQVTDCSLLVVVCADVRAWDKEPERYWRNAPPEVQRQIVPMIRKFYERDPQLARDEAQRSCAFAAENLMLAARGLGYDSCPMDGFDPVRVAELIHLPEDHLVSMFVAIGKALEPARPRAGQLDLEEVRFYDRFP